MASRGREVCFDTETTGLNPVGGDRIVEIGCVELVDLLPTGEVFQTYLDPGKPVSEATTRITGLTDEKLRGQPVFSSPGVVDRLMEFFGSDPIVAHNADFDRGFLNAELERCGRNPVSPDRFVDTLKLARSRFAGQSNSLDALCQRFGVSLAGRELHGALKDAQLLAAVYLELRGGRERMLDLAPVDTEQMAAKKCGTARVSYPDRPRPLAARLDAKDVARHERFVARMTNAIWSKYSRR